VRTHENQGKNRKKKEKLERKKNWSIQEKLLNTDAAR